MRLNLTLFILLLLSCTANAQKLTGIWRGYFSSTGGIYKGAREETYKYEIQIDQQSNDGVKGVTYSYKSTVFYGKAELQGIFTGSSKSVVFKETRLVDIKIGDKSEPCLMTCYLDYSKIGKLEVLEGTFISINVKDKTDCGSGKVYLERVATSDFKLEDFLTKKKPSDSDKTSGRILLTPKKQEVAVAKSKPVFPDPNTGKDKKDNLVSKQVPPTRQTKPAEKPLVSQKKITPPPVLKPAGSSSGATVNKGKPQIKKEDKPIIITSPTVRVPEQPVASQKEEIPNTAPQVNNQTRKAPVPKVLIERENNLQRTITVSEEDVVIAFYDGGEVDNDTISVYHNNELVVSRGRLNNTSPILVKIKCSKAASRHELVIVAENLGDIPPNTAMMIITAGGKERSEVSISSDDKRNAKVVINYVPKE